MIALPVLRHLSIQGHPTTKRIEAAFWEAIDHLAAQKHQTWQEWAADTLKSKPPGVGSASWIRVRCLAEIREGHTYG